MNPHFRNPKPIDTKVRYETLEDIIPAFNKEFDDLWENDYPREGREDYHKYHHASAYSLSGNLESKDNVFFRLINCNASNVKLAKQDTLEFRNSTVNTIKGGYKSFVYLLNCFNLQVIENLENCSVVIENSDISNLKIRNNFKSTFTIINGSSNISGFIEGNELCLFRLNSIQMTSGIPVKLNKEISILGRNIQSNTGEFTFSSNRNSTFRIYKSQFQGNDWVVSHDDACNYFFDSCQFECPHGFRGGNLHISIQGSKVQLGKTFVLSESSIVLSDSQCGGDIVFLIDNSSVNATMCSITAGSEVTESQNSRFHFVFCSLKSGNLIFKSSNDKIFCDECNLESGNTISESSSSSIKSYKSKLQSGNIGFKAIGCVIVNSHCMLEIGNTAYEGNFAQLKLESTQVQCVDGLKGYFGDFIAYRTQIQAEHPYLAGGENSYFEESIFLGHGTLSSKTVRARKVTYGGPMDFFDFHSLDERDCTYSDIVNFNTVYGKSAKSKFQNIANYNDCSLQIEGNEYQSDTTYNGARVAIHKTQYQSNVSITCHVDMHEVNVGGTCSINGTVNLNKSQFSSLNLTGSGSLSEVTSGGGGHSGSFIAHSVNLGGGGGVFLSGGGVTIGGCEVPTGEIYDNGKLRKLCKCIAPCGGDCPPCPC